MGPTRSAAERKHLYLYAMVKLRDPDLADDAVQETLIAALEALAELRRAIGASHLAGGHPAQQDCRHGPSPQPARLRAGDRRRRFGRGRLRAGLRFDRQGMWHKSQRARAPGRIRGALQQQQFWTVFEFCLRYLPAKTAEVFHLREVFGEAIETICKNLGITATNCSVMLYRARMRLRTCLDEKWFSGAGRA
ncbi:MAG: RNA polymerase subunit sigma [Comamonadaceae bacterium]|nr:RNA polymerase subunit sigma [Comamonadaceae bacterium]